MIPNYDYQIEKIYHPENFGGGEIEYCCYSGGDTEAKTNCVRCEAPLCGFCGYIVGGKKFCNECYRQIQKET